MTKKVEKTGVYRFPDGSAVYLTQGSEVDARILNEAKLDGKATAEYGKTPERGFSLGTVDAEQNVKPQDTIVTRAMQAPPENKAMPAPENKSSKPNEQKTDADLVADAAGKNADAVGAGENAAS